MQKIIGTILMIAIGLSFNPGEDKTATTKFSDRETIEVISNTSGEVRRIGDSDTYMIWAKDKFLKLNAYNLPHKFKQTNLAVTFSGNIKLTNTLEDEWGELFEVTEIKVRQ